MPSCSCFYSFRDVEFIRTCNRFNVLQRSQKALKPQFTVTHLTDDISTTISSKKQITGRRLCSLTNERRWRQSPAAAPSSTRPFQSGYFGPVFQPLGVLTLHFKSSEKCFSRFRVGLWQLMMPFCGWTKQATMQCL